jgi:UDP-N-acetylglucosamine acyltransferase
MEIHPKAIVHPHAKLADNVKVGPYSQIGKDVKINSGTSIGSHCVIEGHTSIGKDCKIFTGAVVGSPPQDLKFKGEITYLEIGNNNTIREYVTINPATEKNNKTVIGDDNLIMAYSHIAHDCKIGNKCIIANAGTLAGYVTIEDKAVIGGLVAIHQFVKVGSFSIIGGCSKVVQDIVPYSMCDGHPAKVRGLNVIGLKRGDFPSSIRKDLRKAFKIIFKSKLSLPSALKKVENEIEKTAELSHLIDFIRSSKRGISR